uniref:Uncharacterized protein n=1 Tax=Takifugu rubripes TaxID=31033 RepID=A0A3B5K230_TAKRU
IITLKKIDGGCVLDLTFALAPEEHEDEADGHRAQEGQEAHGGGDDQGLGIKWVRLGHVSGGVRGLKICGLRPTFV